MNLAINELLSHNVNFWKYIYIVRGQGNSKAIEMKHLLKKIGGINLYVSS